jgi:glycine/D-amino acid oxidase-like deaminating enzyme
MPPSLAIIGAGAFGVVAAIALRERGHRVALFDPGPLPHPQAASTDVSKIIRLDYGPDEEYMAWMEPALERWRAWNARWPEPLFHETGVLFLTRAPMPLGGFEHDSYQLLLKRGHNPQRLEPASIRQRFPLWASAGFVDGYYNPLGGYAESGRVVAQLVREAQALGVEVRMGVGFAHLHERGSRVAGIVTTTGEMIETDRVLVAAGAWTIHLLPWLAGMLRSNGLPVWHFKPQRPERFRADRFPVFAADITATGYYGFPLNREGVVKVARHGAGRELHPDSPQRFVTAGETEHCHAFLSETLPELADAEIVFTRLCFYSDTWDGHFWIAPDPRREGLVVAAGDSGHGFKFVPVLGDLIADVVEGNPNPLAPKFRWRPDVRPPRTEEAARLRG